MTKDLQDIIQEEAAKIYPDHYTDYCEGRAYKGYKIGATKWAEIAIGFAKWTCDGLWTCSGNMWYEYRNEDNPITAEQLLLIYLKTLEK